MKYAMQWLGDPKLGLTYFKIKYGNDEKDADCIIGESDPKLSGVMFIEGTTRNITGDNWLIGFQNEEDAIKYFPKELTT